MSPDVVIFAPRRKGESMELSLEHLPKEHDLRKLVYIEAKAVELMRSIFCAYKLHKEELGNLSSEMLMAYLFTERQIRHAESFSLLKGQSDKLLVSRTMFEGALFLAYAVKRKGNEIADKWKLHFYTQWIERANDKDFPPEMRRQIDINRNDIDRFFRKKTHGQAVYSSKWITTNIHDIALCLDDACKSMYDNYYRPMAEYHHWSSLSLFEYSHVNDSDEGSMTSRIVSTINAYLISTFSSLLVVKIFLTLFDRESSDGIKRLKEIEGVEEMLSELKFIKTKKVMMTSST
ncbi:DUF5677 domain-containing protein [Pseudomonas monteilii]|nr:DUF5677 domain-containing protein [Pseudomonas monteilii]